VSIPEDAKAIGRQLLRYSGVGVATLALYAGTNILLAVGLNIWPGVAAGVAMLVASAFNYLGHARFTFQSDRSVSSSLPRYVLLLIFNSVQAAAIVGISADFMGISLVVANSIALICVTITSFFVLKYGVMTSRTLNGER